MSHRIQRRTFLGACAASIAAGTGQRIHSAPTILKRNKKGFCVLTRDNVDWLPRIKALNAEWFYSWGANKPAELPANIEFFPMTWGGWEKNFSNNLNTISQLIESNEISAVLTFNEPDKKEQSNLSVERVIELWPRLMELGVPLVSPACVHADRDWMKMFIGQIENRNYRVDYVSVHSYGWPNADHLMSRLESIYKMYDRPLWVTEFAVGDWDAKRVADNRHSPLRVARFMREILPDLDKAKFIERYSWYSPSQTNAALSTSALFDERGNLTPLGKIYSNH